ncbi:hypothetical protein [Paenibacillus arenilitoris]|uniref:Uncharacterized protein n=1 Tax=Paenibacillus arenilitoris TaxID=2772299 RepID=A0A927CQY9_9BACL|nr:hypothetical protein [Paenibacillus arenilitoris]MBD2870025.1 hypothetical protein [Paenibacillus arenilitoris]
MIGLMTAYILFGAAGFIFLRNLRMQRREGWTFAIMTGVGFILWASIVIGRPLDLNRAIAWMIDNTFYR